MYSVSDRLVVVLNRRATYTPRFYAMIDEKEYFLNSFEDGSVLKFFDPYCGYYGDMEFEIRDIPIQLRSEKCDTDTNEYKMWRFAARMGCYNSKSEIEKTADGYIIRNFVEKKTTFCMEEYQFLTLSNFEIEFHLPEVYLGSVPTLHPGSVPTLHPGKSASKKELKSALKSKAKLLQKVTRKVNWEVL